MQLTSSKDKFFLIFHSAGDAMEHILFKLCSCVLDFNRWHAQLAKCWLLLTFPFYILDEIHFSSLYLFS